MHRGDASEILQAERARILGVNFNERLGVMQAEAGTNAGPRHGVPLIAPTPGVEDERISLVGRAAQRRGLDRNEARLAVGHVEPARGEEALVPGGLACAYWPRHRIEHVESLVADICECAKIEIARAAVFERG